MNDDQQLPVMVANYYDNRRVSGHKVFRIILEVPIELQPVVDLTLGYPANPGSEKWIGLVPLTNDAAAAVNRRMKEQLNPAIPPDEPPPGSDYPLHPNPADVTLVRPVPTPAGAIDLQMEAARKRSYAVAREPSFWQCINHITRARKLELPPVSDEDGARLWIHDQCGIKHRTEIATDLEAYNRFNGLMTYYDRYLHLGRKAEIR